MAPSHPNKQPDPNASSDPASWPTMPEPITGPLPPPTRRGYGSNRSAREDWRELRVQRDQVRNAQQRREYLWRRQFDLQLERQRLAAEEQALQQQWDALPRPASRLLRLLIALVLLAAILAGIVLYPAVLIPLALVLLVVGGVRRRRRLAFRPHDNQWAERERYRIQSRIAWIDARNAAIAQEEQVLSSELLALPALQPDPEP